MNHDKYVLPQLRYFISKSFFDGLDAKCHEDKHVIGFYGEIGYSF